MIFHTIRCKLKASVDPVAAEAAIRQLHKMGQEIPVVQSYCVGPDIGGDFDLGATFVLKNIEDYEVYMHSPIHRQTDEIGLPLLENMVSFDITDDPDPTIGEQIGRIHKERFEGDKSLTDLISGLGSYAGSGKPE
jgi:hypothetical protein